MLESPPFKSVPSKLSWHQCRQERRCFYYHQYVLSSPPVGHGPPASNSASPPTPTNVFSCSSFKYVEAVAWACTQILLLFKNRLSKLKLAKNVFNRLNLALLSAWGLAGKSFLINDLLSTQIQYTREEVEVLFCLIILSKASYGKPASFEYVAV